MRLLAIDPSLTCSGYAYMSAYPEITTGSILTKKLRGASRLYFIRESVVRILDAVQPQVLVLEGYAYGKLVGRMFDLAELGGVLKLLAWERNIPTLVVPPSTLKLFATGSGRADKLQVASAMAKLAGRSFRNDDEADAYALLRLGMAFKSHRHRPRDRRHYINAAISGVRVDLGCGRQPKIQQHR